MADDTASLLQQIGVERTDFFGYSVGSGVALQIAVRHADLVRKLVLVSAPTRERDSTPRCSRRWKA
jgi:pimeloyl-ACP methyl ester carboxylesterase